MCVCVRACADIDVDDDVGDRRFPMLGTKIELIGTTPRRQVCVCVRSRALRAISTYTHTRAQIYVVDA